MGLLDDLVSDVRTMISDENVGAIFTDAQIIHHSHLATKRIFKELTQISSAPVVLRHKVYIPSYAHYVGTGFVAAPWPTSYRLPPSLGRIIQYGYWDYTEERWDYAIKPTDRRNRHFRSVRIEGNALVFDQVPTTKTLLTIEYEPSGDFRCHRASSEYDSAALDTNEFELIQPNDESDDLDYGVVDDRDGAYNGGMLRLWRTSAAVAGGPIEVQERLITDHVVSSSGEPYRKITVDADFSPALVNAVEYEYEVVPTYLSTMEQIIALGTSLSLCAYSAMDKRYSMLRKEYQSALRTEQLAIARRNAEGEHINKDTNIGWTRRG